MQEQESKLDGKKENPKRGRWKVIRVVRVKRIKQQSKISKRDNSKVFCGIQSQCLFLANGGAGD